MPIVNVARVAVEFIFKTSPQGALQAEKLNKRVEQSAKKANGLIGQLGTSLFGLGAATFYTGLKMDDTLVKMTTQLRLTSQETDALRPKFRAMAEEWGQSAERIAEGYYLAVSSGATLAGAMDIVQKSAKLAAGQFGEIEQIASTLTSARIVFDEPAERAADYFAKAIEIGKIPHVREYGAAMARLFGPARTLGVELSEINAMAARLSRIGLPIQEAITQIGEWMVSVIKPSRQADEMLGQLGLTMDDVRKMVTERGFVKAFEDLRTVYGMNTEQLGKMLGRQTALKAALVSTGEYWEETKWIIDEVTNSVGHSEAKARIAQASFGVGLRSALQAAVNELDKLFVSFSFIIRAFLFLPGPLKTAAIALGAFIVMGGVFGHALGIGGAVGIVRLLIASLAILGRFIGLNILYLKHHIFWEVTLNKHRSLSIMWNTLLIGSYNGLRRAMHIMHIWQLKLIASTKYYYHSAKAGILIDSIWVSHQRLGTLLIRIRTAWTTRSTAALWTNTSAVKVNTLTQGFNVKVTRIGIFYQKMGIFFSKLSYIWTIRSAIALGINTRALKIHTAILTLNTRIMKIGLLVTMKRWIASLFTASWALVSRLIPAMWAATAGITAFTVALATNPFTLMLVGIAAVVAAAGAFFGMFKTGMDQIHSYSQRKIAFQSDLGTPVDQHGSEIELAKVKEFKNFWQKGGAKFEIPKANLELYKKLWEQQGNVSWLSKVGAPFADRPFGTKEFLAFVHQKEAELLAKRTPIDGKELYNTGIAYNRVQQPQTTTVSNGPVDQSSNISIENMTIETQATSPEGILEAFEAMQQEQRENVKQNVDNDIAY